jgi:hypothetical protein
VVHSADPSLGKSVVDFELDPPHATAMSEITEISDRTVADFLNDVDRIPAPFSALPN